MVQSLSLRAVSRVRIAFRRLAVSVESQARSCVRWRCCRDGLVSFCPAFSGVRRQQIGFLRDDVIRASSLCASHQKTIVSTKNLFTRYLSFLWACMYMKYRILYKYHVLVCPRRMHFQPLRESERERVAPCGGGRRIFRIRTETRTRTNKHVQNHEMVGRDVSRMTRNK